MECINIEPLTFEITDQWNETVKTLNKEELVGFISGSISITDSNKREWNAINDKSLFKGEEYITEELKKIGVNSIAMNSKVIKREIQTPATSSANFILSNKPSNF